MRRILTRVAVSCLALGLAGAAQAESLRAVQVFVSLAQKTQDTERWEYLQANAGTPIFGAGHLEVVLPRTYYDTSVPDSNTVIVLVQLSPGRKVACGIAGPVTRESMQELREGSSVTFRGKMVDAQDWGQWSTLYLADCSVHPR